MIINLGSKNPVKILALEEILNEYPLFTNFLVNSMSVDSGVSDQPLSINETIGGALNRAKNSFKECDYSVGIESGLMESIHARSGFFGFCACAIYNGIKINIGLSCAFEYPPTMMEFVKKKININEAAYKLGLTRELNVGYACGVISLLTFGRLNRKEYTKQAIRTALIPLENQRLY
mgnify:CR=1 FL=1